MVVRWLRLSPILGYLVAGIAVGPFTPGLVADSSAEVDAIAEGLRRHGGGDVGPGAASSGPPDLVGRLRRRFALAALPAAGDASAEPVADEPAPEVDGPAPIERG